MKPESDVTYLYAGTDWRLHNDREPEKERDGQVWKFS